MAVRLIASMLYHAMTPWSSSEPPALRITGARSRTSSVPRHARCRPVFRVGARDEKTPVDSWHANKLPEYGRAVTVSELSIGVNAFR
jgi:hypothetical protein